MPGRHGWESLNSRKLESFNVVNQLRERAGNYTAWSLPHLKGHSVSMRGWIQT